MKLDFNKSLNNNIYCTNQETGKIIRNQINQMESNNNMKSKISENSVNELIEKYCTYCFIDIPIRGKHCKICNSCIATFDHHCKWVGNCIGENNKKIFLIFLFFHSIETLMVLIVVRKIFFFNLIFLFFNFCYKIFIYFKSLVSLRIKKDMDSLGFFKENYRILILSVLILFPIFFICPMFFFHVKILLKNQTLCKNFLIFKF